jgi:mannose/fructose/N-acetylgalactosamine-specific phosphotransferase system component IID
MKAVDQLVRTSRRNLIGGLVSTIVCTLVIGFASSGFIIGFALCYGIGNLALMKTSWTAYTAGIRMQSVIAERERMTADLAHLAVAPPLRPPSQPPSQPN